MIEKLCSLRNLFQHIFGLLVTVMLRLACSYSSASFTLIYYFAGLNFSKLFN